MPRTSARQEESDRKLAESFAIDLRVIARDSQHEIDQLLEYADSVDRAIKDGDYRALFQEHVMVRAEELVRDVIHVHTGSTRMSNVRGFYRRCLQMARAGGRLGD